MTENAYFSVARRIPSQFSGGFEISLSHFSINFADGASLSFVRSKPAFASLSAAFSAARSSDLFIFAVKLLSLPKAPSATVLDARSESRTEHGLLLKKIKKSPP